MTRKRQAILCLSAALICLPHHGEAAEGVVVYRKARCDHFIVSSPGGFALLEWYGGHDPDEGDRLGGDFEAYGMKDVHKISSDNVSSDAQTRVWVEDFGLSRASVIEKYREKCR